MSLGFLAGRSFDSALDTSSIVVISAGEGESGVPGRFELSTLMVEPASPFLSASR